MRVPKAPREPVELAGREAVLVNLRVDALIDSIEITGSMMPTTSRTTSGSWSRPASWRK
jgi:hypothetical protein